MVVVRRQVNKQKLKCVWQAGRQANIQADIQVNIVKGLYFTSIFSEKLFGVDTYTQICYGERQ